MKLARYLDNCEGYDKIWHVLILEGIVLKQDLELMKKLSCCGHILHHRRCLNQSQNRILLELEKHGSMSQKLLMKHMHIQSGSLSEVLAKVEHAGYITKNRIADDKRNYEVSLTESGKKQAELFEKHQAEMAGNLFAGLSVDQKDALEAILDTLLADWAEMKSCRLCERGEKK